MHSQPKLSDADAIHHEKMVLGCMMLDSSQIKKSLTMKSAFFRLPKHRFIFEAILSVYRSLAKVNVLSVSTALEEKHQTLIVGGLPYLIELTAYVQKAAKAHHAAAIRSGVKQAGGKV